MSSFSPYLRTACVLLAFATAACLGPKVEDTVLSEARSPSGQMKATVIERNVGLLTPTSLIVFVHPSAKRPDKGTAVIAITDGAAPTVAFVDDTKLQVRIAGGTKHNQIREALGVSILYE